MTGRQIDIRQERKKNRGKRGNRYESIKISFTSRVAKNIDKASYRTYCLIGDGESAEGSIWEAMAFASYYHLDNLVAVIDVNRLGQSEAAPLQHQLDVYEARAKAFGWNALVVDGHDVEALCKAFAVAGSTKGQPTCIIAKTFKGMVEM